MLLDILSLFLHLQKFEWRENIFIIVFLSFSAHCPLFIARCNWMIRCVQHYFDSQSFIQGTWSEYAKSIDAERQVPKPIEQKITPFQKVW